MTVINADLIGVPIKFEVYPSSVLGATFPNFTITSILSALDAREFADIAVLHQQVYPYLPATVEDNYRSYQYIRGYTQDNEVKVLGIPWIKEDSILISGDSMFFIRVAGSTPNAENFKRAKRALVSYGFTQLTVSEEPLGKS